MASNNDSSGKGQQKPGPDASKKPTAVIDLKPTEVDIKDPKQAAKAASSVAEAAAQAAASAKGTSSGKPGAPSSPAASPAAASSATSNAKTVEAGKGKPGQGASPNAPSATSGGAAAGPKAQTVSVPPAKAGGGGLRSAATHLVAGLAGGLLALIGADSLLPHLAPESARAPSVSAQLLEQRIKALESASSSRQGSAELVQRLAAAEERVAQAERAARQVSEQQIALAGETKALSERVAQPAADNAVAEERVAKLEEMFNTLSQAAANDTQRGRIPQLATIVAKLTDLETSLATQIGQLRKSVTTEVDSRLSQSTEAAQAARAGTQRLDRELAGVKNETAQVSGRLDGIKAQTDKLEASLQRLGEQTAALKNDLTKELSQAAKSAEVSTALSPIASKLAALEQNVQGVVRSEDDRRANVERIVTALELNNMKRTVDRGAPFAAELAEVRRVAGPKVDLGILERYKDQGVPTMAVLERDLRPLTFRIIEADKQPTDAHWTDRLLASAKSVVRVRKVDQGAEEAGTEATVSRMERALKEGKLAEVLAEAGKLSAQAKAPAKAWLEKVEARAAVDKAITAVEQELKSSLGAASQAGKKG